MREIDPNGPEPVVCVDTDLINAIDRIGTEGFALYCIIRYAYLKRGALPSLGQLGAFCRRVVTTEGVGSLLYNLRDAGLLTTEELDTIWRVNCLG